MESLNLVVGTSTCFGLLGENGAGHFLLLRLGPVFSFSGKTTTISMLTGLFPPTLGDARVGGFSITNEIDNVHKIMGLCPQFDVLWDDLTCFEHILFYLRLKVPL